MGAAILGTWVEQDDLVAQCVSVAGTGLKQLALDVQTHHAARPLEGIRDGEAGGLARPGPGVDDDVLITSELEQTAIVDATPEDQRRVHQR
jgi:hypothetical protein